MNMPTHITTKPDHRRIGWRVRSKSVRAMASSYPGWVKAGRPLPKAIRLCRSFGINLKPRSTASCACL